MRGDLLVFGDSHSVIWEGNLVPHRSNPKFKNVKVFHLGESLAYNLMDDDGYFGKWGRRIVTLIEEYQNQGNHVSGIMLCFGEIDIRTRVVLRAKEIPTTLKRESYKIAGRIISCSNLLYEKFKIPVLIWEPVPTTSDKFFNNDPRYPTNGTELERNLSTIHFSDYIREHTTNQGTYSFGLVEDLTDEDLRTKYRFYEDGCHLNLRGLDLAIDRLEDLCVKYNLEFHKYFRN